MKIIVTYTLSIVYKNMLTYCRRTRLSIRPCTKLNTADRTFVVPNGNAKAASNCNSEKWLSDTLRELLLSLDKLKICRFYEDLFK
jgi:hypothetical protein